MRSGRAAAWCSACSGMKSCSSRVPCSTAATRLPPRVRLARLLLPAVAFAGISVARASAQDGGKKPELPAEAERIGDELYRVGKVTVDLHSKTLTCAGKVNMHRGMVEYFAVAP